MWCSFIRGGDSSVCCLDKGYLKMVFQVAFVMTGELRGDETFNFVEVTFSGSLYICSVRKAN